MTFTIHVVRPPLGEELDVVDSYERLYRAFAIGTELWRLLGDTSRAEGIDATVASAFDHSPRTLHTAELVKLLALIEPLDRAIVGPLTDDDERLSPAKVVELRGLTTVFDLDESRGDDAQAAVSEAMIRIRSLQGILRAAIADHHVLVIE